VPLIPTQLFSSAGDFSLWLSFFYTRRGSLRAARCRPFNDSLQRRAVRHRVLPSRLPRRIGFLSTSQFISIFILLAVWHCFSISAISQKQAGIEQIRISQRACAVFLFEYAGNPLRRGNTRGVRMKGSK
jgi:hypothetical protein